MVLAVASTSKKLKEDSPESSAAARNFLAATVDRGSISDAPTNIETWGGLATGTDSGIERGDVNFEAPPKPVFSSVEERDPTRAAIDVRSPRTETKPTFFSADNSGRPEQVAAYYGGETQRQKDILKREIDAFNTRFPIRTTDTPVDRPRGRGMGDTWEGPQSDASSEVDWRPRTVEVGRIASTDGRGLFNDTRDEPPSTRPILARDRVGVRAEGQSGLSASRLGGRTGGRQQLAGTRPTGTSTSFNVPSSANPNQSGPLGWWNKGRNVNVPNESTASWRDLWIDNQRQAGQSNQNYQKGTKPGFFGRPDRSVLGIDIPESIKNRKVVTVPAEQGGPGSGPTPLVRQVTERILAPVATGSQIFAQGQTGSNLYQAVESAADYVPGLRANPETDVGKRTGDFLAEKAGDVKDWFVDKMGNIRKDEQARQIRQAGLGTDIRGNIVSENQRIKAADEFIAGMENWEPLTDQRTFEEIPEVRGGIVDGQWDDDYLVAPASKTETTAPAGSAFNKDNLPGWFQHSYTDDDGTFMGYNYSGGFGALTPGSGGGELGTPESGYGTPGYNWDTNSGGTSWTFTDYDTYSSANKSPVVSDVGTVNDLGEVVPNLGVEDGDEVASSLSGGSYGGYFNLGRRGYISPEQGQRMLNKPGAYNATDEELRLIRENLGILQASLPSGEEVTQVASAGDLSGLGVTNQPATVDLNKSAELPPPPTSDEFLDEYIPPSQPYDQQEPVGNYIKNEETGEIYQIADAPSISESVGSLPSQEAWVNPQSSDFQNPAADKAWADYNALIEKNKAENRRRYARYSSSGYGYTDDEGNYSYRYKLPFPTYTDAGEAAAKAAYDRAAQGGSYRNIPSYNVVNAHLL